LGDLGLSCAESLSRLLLGEIGIHQRRERIRGSAVAVQCLPVSFLSRLIVLASEHEVVHLQVADWTLWRNRDGFLDVRPSLRKLPTPDMSKGTHGVAIGR